MQRLSKIMSSSKGRDKICGIIQYLAKMIALTAMYSNIKEVQFAFLKKEMKFHLTAYRTYKSLSQARKIFRFLKFLEVIEDILIISHQCADKRTLKLHLQLFAKISSFFYYLLDNIVWLIKSQILNDIIDRHTKRNYINAKNSFSLFKSCFSLLYNYLELREINDERLIIIQKLQNVREGFMNESSTQYALGKKLIHYRFKV